MRYGIVAALLLVTLISGCVRAPDEGSGAAAPDTGSAVSISGQASIGVSTTIYH